MIPQCHTHRNRQITGTHGQLAVPRRLCPQVGDGMATIVVIVILATLVVVNANLSRLYVSVLHFHSAKNIERIVNSAETPAPMFAGRRKVSCNIYHSVRTPPMNI